MMNYVTAYAGDKNHDRIVMLVKDRPEYLKGVLLIPGGKIEEGEDPVQAALRELREETGLVATEGELMGTLHGTKSHISYIRVIFEDNDLDLQPREGETEKPFWVNPEAVVGDSRLMPNLRLIFPLIHYGMKGWHILDETGEWRTKKWHKLKVRFPDELDFREVKVLGMGRDDEEE